MSFEQLNLHARISKAINICGYTEPTAIQSRSIPDILDGKDVVACAQTGTGKTAAFVLPALHRIVTTPPSGKPRVLILTPTRELATQITDAVARYGKFLQVNIVSLLGGMPYHKQLKLLSRQVDIIVATPGRLMDHMERRRVDLSSIEMLILDEADRMLDMGFIDDVTLIAKKTPATRQTLLFSATVDNRIATVVRDLLKNPIRIDITKEKNTPTHIEQKLYFADSPQHKTRLLHYLLENENMYKAIIFTATKVYADILSKELSDMGYPAAPLHGDLKQNLRNRTVDALRRGKIQFLVATDVAARGIDISDITHVINFDMPRFSEDYVHRIGRTGRAGKDGIAISFALPSDSRHLQSIERYTSQKFSPSIIPGLEPKKRQSQNAAPNKSKRFKSGGSEKGRKWDNGGKKERWSKSAKSEKSDSWGRGERSEKSRPWGKSERSEKSSNWSKPERSEKSWDKSERSDKPRSWAKPERSEKSNGWSKSEKSEKSRSWDKSERSDKPRSWAKPERSEKSNSWSKSEKSENSRPRDKAERSEKPRSWAKPVRSEKSNSWSKSEKSEKSRPWGKSERSEKSSSWSKPERSEKTRTWDKSEKSEKSSSWGKSDRSAKPESWAKSGKSSKPAAKSGKSEWAKPGAKWDKPSSRPKSSKPSFKQRKSN